MTLSIARIDDLVDTPPSPAESLERGAVDWARAMSMRIGAALSEASSAAAAAEPTDEQLVRAFQRGSDREGAFMHLFDRYGSMTLAFLRRRIGSPDIAAELNQELYLAVLEGLDRFRGESSFKTWLFRMAQNRLSNLRRRWRTHLDELPEGDPAELVEHVLASDGAQPDEEIDRDERTRLLESCLAALPEIERAVVTGQYYEGITLEELTQRFQLTNRSGARAALIAGQRKLRRCLERSGVAAAH
jgi:RNA polymerase sigma-70 factor (ECF subfamily)